MIDLSDPKVLEYVPFEREGTHMNLCQLSQCTLHPIERKLNGARDCNFEAEFESDNITMDVTRILVKPLHDIAEDINFCARCDGLYYPDIGYRKITINKSVPPEVKEETDWLMIVLITFCSLNVFYAVPVIMISFAVFAVSLFEVFQIKTNSAAFLPVLETSGGILAAHTMIAAAFTLVIKLSSALRFFEFEGYL